MTTLRQAAEMALEALGKTMGVWGGTCAWHNDVGKAIDALKEALAQPEQGPVAYRYKDSRAHYRYVGNRPNMDTSSYTILKLEPLYLHPAPIPEGWQLVPIEPTSEMVNAFLSKYGGRKRYKAMLAAAPKYEEQSK